MPVPAFLHPFARPAAERFITIVSGEGAIVVDDAGTSLHRRPGQPLVLQRRARPGRDRRRRRHPAADAREVPHVRPVHQRTDRAAHRELVDLAPMPNARVFLTSQGSEAVDSAIKLARMAHWSRRRLASRQLVVSRRPSYHGVTYGGMTATGLPPTRRGSGRCVGDVSRCDNDDLDALDAVFAEGGDEVRGGDRRAGHRRRRRAATRRPTTSQGLRRVLTTGRRVPDPRRGHLRLRTAGRVVGRAALRRRPRPRHLRQGGHLRLPAPRRRAGRPGRAGPARGRADLLLRHGHTYSGHPTACAAAIVDVAIIEQEGLLDRARTIGERWRRGCESSARRRHGARRARRRRGAGPSVSARPVDAGRP